MTLVWRFVLYNLSLSLAAGLLAWVVVMLVLRSLRAQNAFLYSSFLALPLVKSIFILLGLGLVFPWNGLSGLSRLALPAQQILPFIVLWFVAALGVYRWLVHLARRQMLEGAVSPVGDDQQRLEAALSQVVSAYQQAPCCEAGETVCCVSENIPAQPRLLLSHQIKSPVALVEGGQPVVIFPEGLVKSLEDQELALALAHELNHFALRKQGGWSAGNLRLLALVSPVAVLLADALHREEEKACDDLAVRMLGGADAYAEMLMKSYQFARGKSRASLDKVFLPQMLGARPFISERIERLLSPAPVRNTWSRSGLVVWPVWVLLLYLLFFAHFGA